MPACAREGSVGSAEAVPCAARGFAEARPRANPGGGPTTHVPARCWSRTLREDGTLPHGRPRSVRIPRRPAAHYTADGCAAALHRESGTAGPPSSYWEDSMPRSRIIASSERRVAGTRSARPRAASSKRPFRIGLFGFGRTGKLAAAEIIKDPDCVLRWVVRSSRRSGGRFASRLLGLRGNSGLIVPLRRAAQPSFLSKEPVDVIIDFSAASALSHYGQEAASRNVRIVTAVSKYGPQELELLRRISERTAVLHSPNITVGINILMVVAQLLRKIFPDADVEIVEEHFRDKREVSGTAVRIAELLGLDTERHVNSVRVGGIIGNHQVIFGLRNQTVRVAHESVTRSAFGRGAVYAAKWVRRAPSGFYKMEQIIRERFIDCLRELMT